MAEPRVLLGTSGWSYPSGYGKWQGVFYPKGLWRDELAYYAERFPAVEVNASFYRLPAAETVRAWVERTPQTFRFTVKLFRKFTHPEFYHREEGKSPVILPEDILGVRHVLDILAEHERLGALLVQYPEFFTMREESMATLVRTLDSFRAYPLAVELRHHSWEHPRTRELLGHYGAALVRIDEPFYQNFSCPYMPDNVLQYWRFHGRNETEWRKPGAGARRYEYLYTPDEIDNLVAAIQKYQMRGRDTYIFFNNHVGGMALANAVQLAKRAGLDVPYDKFAHLSQYFPALRDITGEPGGQLGLLEN